MNRRLRSSMCVFVAAVLASPALWAAGIDDYKLAKAIPGDAFLSLHTRGHDGQAWLNKQLERVWKKVEEAKFERDLKRIFKELAKEGGQTPEQFDEQWTKFVDLGAAVDWASLGAREYAFGMKITNFTPEFVSIMMPTADKVESNFNGLTGIIKSIAGMNPGMMALATEGEGDTVIHKIAFPGLPPELSFGVTVARQKDVILIGFGSTLVEQSLALLQGKPGKSISTSPRFQEAFKKLPAPTDSATFCDVSLLMAQVRELMTQVFKMAETQGNPPKEGDPDYDKYIAAKKIPGKIIDALDIFEYSASVSSTDGLKTLSQEHTLLKDGASGKPFHKIMFGNGPVKDPLKFIPKNASDFAVSSGIDVAATWAFLTDLIKNDIPDGNEFFEGLEQMKAETGFDIEADLLSWLKGTFTSISVPGPTTYASGEFAIMLGVTNEEKANAAIDKVIELAKANIPEDQGRIEDADVPGGKPFRVARIQALGMMPGLPSKPTVGIREGHLFIASSPEFVISVLETGAGKAENFGKNERFAKECVQPSGAVNSLSFTDQSQLGEQLSMAFGSLGMVSMMAPPEIARNPLFQSAMGASTKIARVVKELNFFQSTSAMMTVDGNVVMTKSIATYREPPVQEKPKSAATDEKPNQ